MEFDSMYSKYLLDDKKNPSNSKVKLELERHPMLPAVCCKTFCMQLLYQIMLLKSVGH